MGVFAELLLGNGTLSPRLKATLESEGLVLLEEGLPGSLRYQHFKAPGRRHHGKVRAERFGIGISQERVAVYCRSGRTKLVDTPFSDPRLSALGVSLEGQEEVVFTLDFDRADVPRVSGVIEIRSQTSNAPTIVEQLKRRLGN